MSGAVPLLSFMTSWRGRGNKPLQATVALFTHCHVVLYVGVSVCGFSCKWRLMVTRRGFGGGVLVVTFAIHVSLLLSCCSWGSELTT
jgi:hypothetical protein